MTKKIFYSLSLSLLLYNCCCSGQAIALTDFKVADTPAINSAGWYRLNNSVGDAFAVSMDGGQLRIRRYKEDDVTGLDLPQGRLLGVNYGEFGGGLYYKPADSTRPFFVNGHRGGSSPTFFGGLMVPSTNPIVQRIKGFSLLANGQVVDIFKYKDSLFFIEGLAHMGLSFGALYSLGLRNDSFFITKTIAFDDAPQAVRADGDRLWVATLQGFYRIEDGQKSAIFGHLFWYALYPNSIAVGPDGYIYVGHRGGYSRIDPVKKELVFYQYER